MNGVKIEAKINSVRKAKTSKGDVHVSREAEAGIEELTKEAKACEMVIELPGFGVVQKIDDSNTIVTEFIPPESILYLDIGMFVLGSNKKLIDMISSNEITFLYEDNQVSIHGKDEEDGALTYQVNEDGSIDYSYETKHLKEALGKRFPTNVSDFTQDLAHPNTISLSTSFEVVACSGSLTMTSLYFDRVEEIKKAQDLPVDFHLHFHPHYGLAKAIFSEKSIPERQNYYDTLLTPSEADLSFYKDYGISVFEIRALGMPEDLESGVTHKTFLYDDLEKRALQLQEFVEYLKSKDPLKREEIEGLNGFIGLLQEQLTKESLSARILLKHFYGINESDFQADTVQDKFIRRLLGK